jgi:hypothetical protein
MRRARAFLTHASKKQRKKGNKAKGTTTQRVLAFGFFSFSCVCVPVAPGGRRRARARALLLLLPVADRLRWRPLFCAAFETDPCLKQIEAELG